MRFSDWENRLADWLRECRGLAFAWGQLDCCTFAAGAVRAMTGDDHMAEFRGHYSSAIGAARALRKYGAASLAATLDGKFAVIEPGLARRGDIVLCDSGGGGGGAAAQALAVVLGADAVGVGQQDGVEGLIRIGRAGWLRAWRVE